ncbi:MAG: alpha-mannosidase [Dolichospermum circinale Clear-D4]|nr:alpha-mannosidase [Dolichospermum circinale Clear-D4]
MTLPLSSLNTKSISTAIENLRACCQVDIQSNWKYHETDAVVTDFMPFSIIDWQPVEVNEKGHISWKGGKQVLWLGQDFSIPPSLQDFPLSGMSLRLALVWWAENVEVYVNGELVLVGDLFDASPRVLISPQVSPGENFTIILRLVSPEHCDGALMRSLAIYETMIYNHDDAGFIADELAIVEILLENFAPEKLPALSAAVERVTNLKNTENQDWKTYLLNLRQTYLGLSDFICEQKPEIHLLGHAHLDLAWLWVVAETWKAAQNTFESVLKLQQDFPELIFCHTTPALYAWVEENRPDLFREIQNQVEKGKWEILGGFWVEPDLNLIAGESIVRQLLYGQRYFLHKFGKISPVVWVLDTFGFCATLPQFLANAGIEFFVTQKLRWNDTTKFNYDLFWWRSPDGSQILSFMSPPMGETVEPVKMVKYACEWKTQTGLQTSLWLPGVGDHGGGPTRDMLEVARRWEHSPIFPKLKFTTAQKYLQKIKSQSQNLPSQNLPTWENELYLEFHRGCYTTHGDQKRWNRKSEHLLYSAELFATLANILCGRKFPHTEIETAWKKVLFNQFHDILPGSSITQVYQDALPAWEAVEKVGKNILANSLIDIASQISLPQPPDHNAIPIIIFNPLNWERREVVSVDLSKIIIADQEEYENSGENYGIFDIQGKEISSQPCENSTLLFLPTVPSLGYSIFWLSRTSPTQPQIFPKNWILENEYLQIQVNPETGDLDSVFDKTQQREILNGAGNQLQAFSDSGQYWDAWNIDPDYNTKPLPPTKLKSIQWQEYGEIQQRLRVVRQLGKSEFCQDYILQLGSPLLKIANTVNWLENQVLVKTAFPLNFAAEFVTYEIPCGVIRRPTNPQTPADKAKWEVPALRWSDITTDTQAGKYGVSLINDCKYGYDAQPNQLRLTLLRSSQWPDKQADTGIHQFTYGLYSHLGSWEEADTVKRGYELNVPLEILVNPPKRKFHTKANQSRSFLDLSADNLIMMALKTSEDHPEKYILRCYECHQKTAELFLRSDFLTLGQPLDLLEQYIKSEEICQGAVNIQPGKIVSFEVVVNI